MAFMCSPSRFLTGLFLAALSPCCLFADEKGFSPELSPARSGLAGTTTRIAEKQESVLSGIYINGNESGTINACLENGEYWIPWDFFLEQTRLKTDGTKENKTLYPTSIGIIEFDPGELKTFEKTLCVSFSSLKNIFRVFPSFNQSLYAVVLTIPWQPGAPQKQAVKTTPNADISAPNSSISFIRIESDLLYDFKEKSDTNLLIETGGRLLGGTWDITLEGDPRAEMIPASCHWTTYNRHIAFRAGTGTNELYSLTGSNDFTGAQFGWSNRDILRYLDFDRYNDSETFLALDRSQLRTIEGDGPPAGIAELRLDGKIAARQRISLEGKFIFRNVRMSSDLRKTEVYVYERSLADNPVTILDFTQSISSRALPAGELLIRGGAGRTGNLLDRNDANHGGDAFFGHLQYGLDNRITVEAGIQNNSDTGTPDLFAGTIVSAGSNWTAALFGARSNNRHAGEFRLEGWGRHWRGSLWSSMQEKYFGNDNSLRKENHVLNISLQPFKNMNISLYGRSEKEEDTFIGEYLLPGFNWNVFRWMAISATPDDDENYSYETQIRFSSATNLRIGYKSDLISADFNHDFSEKLKMRVASEHFLKTRDNVTTCYFDWYPGKNNFDLIEAGVAYSQGRAGFSGSWSKYINAGLRFALRYSYNMNNAQALDIDELSFIDTSSEAAQYIACALTWDLGWSGKSFHPINRTAVSTTRGGISGSLAIESETTLSASDINNVSILLNGRSMQQRQIDGSFFVGNLRPGVYNVSVDPENLPVELVVDQATRNVEVKSGSVTHLSIPVHAQYGIAGKITDTYGQAIPNVLIEIRDASGTEITRSYSNEFGYYRADELRSGAYEVKTVSVNGIPLQGEPSKSITIKNDYLFNVDITIPVRTIPAVPGSQDIPIPQADGNQRIKRRIEAHDD